MAEEIPQKKVDPIWPWMQEPFGDWLFSSFKQDPTTGHWGFAPSDDYQGQLTPNLDATRLSDVYKSWQPYDAGTSYLLDYFTNNRGGIGTNSPLSQQMTQWGGTGGPGNQAMSNMMQFGTPSEAGRGMANLSQFGFSSPQAGGPMAALANGQMNGPAAFLAPFLMKGGGGGNSYQAPLITPRQVERRA